MLLLCLLFKVVISCTVYNDVCLGVNSYYGCCLRMFTLLSLIVKIISIEMTAQKNPISGIWDWNFGQVMVMVAVIIDILDIVTNSKFIYLFRRNLYFFLKKFIR